MNTVPFEIGLRMSWHIWSNRLAGRERFPMVTMLEPLETCNLSCMGCGRVIEYRENVIQKRLMVSVEKCLEVVRSAGTPVVSIAGGEPLIHPQIDEIVAGVLGMNKFVFLCTNGLLMENRMKRIPPSRRFCWVVHLDGTASRHDHWARRKGAWHKAMQAVETALARGYRVCTNTTIFNHSDVDDLHRLFEYLTRIGVEGILVSAGYPYATIPTRDIFLDRSESKRTFRQVLNPEHGFRLINNPLYLEFLRGEHEAHCTAWTNPTYTPMGWRKPCYLVADEHTETLAELMQPELWQRYGDGRDARCASCTMHSGYEAGILQQAITTPAGFGRLLKSYGRAALKRRRRAPAIYPLAAGSPSED